MENVRELFKTEPPPVKFMLPRPPDILNFSTDRNLLTEQECEYLQLACNKGGFKMAGGDYIKGDAAVVVHSWTRSVLRKFRENGRDIAAKYFGYIGDPTKRDHSSKAVLRAMDVFKLARCAVR